MVCKRSRPLSIRDDAVDRDGRKYPLSCSRVSALEGCVFFRFGTGRDSDQEPEHLMTQSIVFCSNRRTVLKLLASAATLVGMTEVKAATLGMAGSGIEITDSILSLSFDAAMFTQVGLVAGASRVALTAFDPSECLRSADGRRIERFARIGNSRRHVRDPQLGSGQELTLTGYSPEEIEKVITVRLFDRYPGFAILAARYRNMGKTPLVLGGWSNGAHIILPDAAGSRAAWTFSGASFADRRDWIQPVLPGFDQRNFMGMNASDYGGGTPCSDVWRRDAGLAVGHVETAPQLLSLPVTAVPEGTRIAVEAEAAVTLGPGEVFATPLTFLAAHRGDCFSPLQTFQRVLADRGIVPAKPNDDCYEPNWCAWGYERLFTVDQMVATLPKVRELGIPWAVLDDGWQTAEGDWYLDPKKFPRGDADMKALVKEIRRAGLKPKLWIAPLAVDPGTDLLRHHTDMLLLNENGAVQDVTWWNAFYLCPAYPKTLERTKALVRKIFKEWGFAGVKLDGQHLNAVAPCHNPAHGHRRPEESIEQLQNFWRELYDTARAINPDAVIELCPCGTSYAFHNMIGHNQSVASDPLSSWQVRHKGKVLKALGGPHVAYSGDHVELSDNGDDFASTVGIGAIPFTKFTWPVDPKPKDSFLLTPDREATWRRWLNLYREKMLPKGQYQGGLYDIGFDRPEAHVTAKDGLIYYAFYANRHRGDVEFRGLPTRRHSVKDLWSGRHLGTVSGAAPRLPVSFERFLFVELTPLRGTA